MKRGTPEHPKTLALARRIAGLLGIDRQLALDVAIAKLERLWHWTAKWAPSGDLSPHAAEAIEDGIGWTGELGALVDAMVEVRFLDRLGDRLVVHDWSEHADGAVHASLARSVGLFADGARPKPPKLGPGERARIDAAYAALALPAGHESDAGRTKVGDGRPMVGRESAETRPFVAEAEASDSSESSGTTNYELQERHSGAGAPGRVLEPVGDPLPEDDELVPQAPEPLEIERPPRKPKAKKAPPEPPPEWAMTAAKELAVAVRRRWPKAIVPTSFTTWARVVAGIRAPEADVLALLRWYTAPARDGPGGGVARYTPEVRAAASFVEKWNQLEAARQRDRGDARTGYAAGARIPPRSAWEATEG